MILEKKLQPPDVGEKILRVTPAYLDSSERVFRSVAVGFREEDGKFVTAEGSQQLSTLQTPVAALYATRSGVIRRTASNGYTRPDGSSFGLNFAAEQAVSVPEPAGGVATLFVGGGKTVLVRKDSLKDLTNIAGGADCAAVHHERIFLGTGNILSYSAPLDAEDWSGNMAGKVSLPETGGAIRALLSFGERLYVFRERELLRLRADANDLNFSFERVHFGCGNFLAGTLQPCGEKMIFATPRGLVSGDGSSFRYLPGSRFGFTFPARPQTANSGGKYYALVLRGGKNCVFVYEPETDRHHFLDLSAECLAGAGDGVYFVHGTGLRVLTAQGFLYGEAQESTLEGEMEIGGGGGETRRIDAVSVTGTGSFLLGLETEYGKSSISLEAGRKTELARVLRGTFLKFSLRGQEPSCAFRALNLHFREETP